MLVRVLSRVEADALALEGAEDALGAVVLVEVCLLRLEGLGLLLEVSVGGCEGLAGGADEGGFLAGGCVVGEETICDEPDAEGVEGAVEERAGEGWEIGFEVVDWGC